MTEEEEQLSQRILKVLSAEHREAFNVIKRLVQYHAGPLGNEEPIEEPLTGPQLIAYGQLLLCVYRQVRRGLLPDPEILKAVRDRLPNALQAQLEADEKAAKEKCPSQNSLSREVLADKLLKSDGRLSRFATLPPESIADVKHIARLEQLRELQACLHRRFLRRSLRTPAQIFHHLVSSDNGVSLSQLGKRGSVITPDTKETMHIKLEIILGSQGKNRGPRRGLSANLFGALSVLKEHHMGPTRLCMARAIQIRTELVGFIRTFNDTKKLKRENAKLLARSAAAKVSAIETRRVQIKEREQRERIKALRDCDMESYMRLVKQTKNKRIHEILQNTERLLMEIGAKVELERAQAEKAGTETTTEGTEVKDMIEPIESTSKDTTDSKETEQEKKPQYHILSHRVREKVQQPETVVGGKLMPYQIGGLEFMVSLYNNNISGILADEMGLGKTIQTIAFLAYLKEVKHNNGPHLVAVPLSTMPNWANEFEKWCPSLKVLQYRGNKNERRNLHGEVRRQRYNVLLTTFEYILREYRVLSSPKWKFIIVDEGHKMKNYKSKFHATLGDFRSTHRLLLTGTPLQNNLQELWSLLNFLMPQTFSSHDDFEKWFEEPFKDQFVDANKEDTALTEEEKLVVINRLHLVLRPFLLRRIKSDVLSDLPSKREYIVRVQLSKWQQLVYGQLVNRCLKVRDSSGKITSKSVANVIMQLRKVVNHPYLFLDEYKLDDNLWRVAGKFEVLDRMLPKLLEFRHKVLLFCQMTQVMDILGDYLAVKNIKYHRLDGSMMVQDRQDRMDDFNLPDSDTFVFILSTRAGGLGLNLQAADTVILFDSDWNPHQDLQAQARAHRVGQRNEVRVFRLVTVSPVEELILAKAQHKLSIDEQIIQAGMFSSKFDDSQREERLRELLSHKGEVINVRVTSPQELNRFMARTDEEDESFTSMDKHIFGHQIWKQFYEDFEESEGPASDRTSEAGQSDAVKPVTSSPVDTSNEFEASSPKSEKDRDSSKIEQLLIEAGRLVADDEIPADILLVQAQPKDEESFFNVQADLGVRKSRLRSRVSNDSENSRPEEDAGKRSTRRKRKLDS